MAAPADARLLPSVAPAAEHRERLLGGMALALAEKGYVATTLADVVRHARVSRRTFYEHFTDKEDLFLALYSTTSDALMALIADTSERTSGGWEERVAATVRVYLATLAEQPALSRAMLVDIHAAGPRALELRLEVQKRYADQLVRLVDQGRQEFAGVPALPGPVASAITGGLYELVLLALVEGGEVTALTEDATRFVSSVLRGLAT